MNEKTLESLHSHVDSCDICSSSSMVTSKWKERRQHRRKIAAIAYESMERGNRKSRLLLDVSRRARKECGLSPWQMIQLASLIINIIRAVQAWRAKREQKQK